MIPFTRNCLRRCFTTSAALKNVTNSNAKRGHVPVLAIEVLAAFQPKDGQVYLDMTFGAGGHSEHLLNAADIKLFALDRDPYAHSLAVELAKCYDQRLVPLLGKFSDVPRLLFANSVDLNSIDGILFDAGCSSMQLDNLSRGFALSKDGPLDMRMDADRINGQPTAADVVNTLSEDDLAKIFKFYGEEKCAKKVARGIVEARYMFRPLRTTQELAQLVDDILDKSVQFDKLQRPAHPATKVFQALRIFVNNELNELNHGVEVAHAYLKTGGRLVAISFHSLEDRIFKRHFSGGDMDEPVSHSLGQKYRNAALLHDHNDIVHMLEKKWAPLYRDVITPSADEVDSNPRSRSAKLRAAIKVL